MSRADELQALAERVEAEGISNLSFYDAFPNCVLSAVKAYRGSLDACAALHKAVLGDRWRWQVWETFTGDSSASLMTRSVQVFGNSRDPARAWLAAILRALASEAAS